MSDIQKFKNRNTVEIVPHGGTPSCQTPSSMIELAITKGADLDKLEKLMELQDRWDKNEAKKSYIEAMAEFKADPPEIEKDKKVSFGSGKTSYRHASLANVTKKINQGLSKHGLSVAWTTFQNNGDITVTCTITHKFGHSESTSLSASPDTSGSKNAIQAIGSTISYLERYTVLALTGLATHDMDDDGQEGGIEYITLDMQTEIYDLIKSTKANKAKVLKYLGAESVEKILLSEYGKTKVAFEAKKKESVREPGQEG